MQVSRPFLISAIIGCMTLVSCAQPNGKPMITFMKNSQHLSGKWYGQATCINGDVSQLSLTVNGTPSGKLNGTLVIVQNNNRSGVYSFDGQFEQDATLRLTPVQWHQKTGNPSSLALTGNVDDANLPTVIRGNVPECGGTFELGRAPLMSTNVPSIKKNQIDKPATSPVVRTTNISEKYDDSCHKALDSGGSRVDIYATVECLNTKGFNLVTNPPIKKDKALSKYNAKDNRCLSVKLKSFSGKDITPTQKTFNKNFDNSCIDYRFVDGHVHVLYGQTEISENLCIDARSGKGINCNSIDIYKGAFN